MPHSPTSMLSRRNLIQLGGASYLGLNWGSLIRAQVAAAEADRPGAIRSCILLFYYGGPSHLDTYDMKPGAPVEIRGTFQPISTSVPGLQICEHLPHMSRVMDKVAIIRSVQTDGYSITVEQMRMGALSVAGPLSRLPDERIKQLGPLVAHTAEELTKRLGGRWPHGR